MTKIACAPNENPDQHGILAKVGENQQRLVSVCPTEDSDSLGTYCVR